MKIDEITLNRFYAPLLDIQDNLDDEGEQVTDETDFWNIYNPEEMDIPEADRKDLEYHRKQIRQCGEQYWQDVNQFLDAVKDQETLSAAADMVNSLDSFCSMHSGIMQYSETLMQTAALEQTISTLKQTISTLKSLEKEHPELKEKIRELNDQCAMLEAKRRKLPHGFIRHFYYLFQRMYKGTREVTERVFENWCNGIHAPSSFPKRWYNLLELQEFAEKYDRGEKSEGKKNTFSLLDKDIYEE